MWVGEMVVVIVVMLFDLPGDCGVIGLELVATVDMLLLLVLPPEDPVDELLPLELIFRNLLKAPILETGGLEASDRCACEGWDSGAA